MNIVQEYAARRIADIEAAPLMCEDIKAHGIRKIERAAKAYARNLITEIEAMRIIVEPLSEFKEARP